MENSSAMFAFKSGLDDTDFFDISSGRLDICLVCRVF
jgi:hypothetical protein